MSDPLKEEIQAYYEAQQLPDSSVEEILESARRTRALSRWKVRTGIAAAIVVGLSTIFFFQPDLDARHQLAEQIAHSHLTHFPSEFDLPADDLVKLEARMTKLDFPLAESAIEERFEVRGARYCNVGGKVACALTVSDRGNGKVGSLFIARLTQQFAKIEPGICRADGVAVEFWHDGDRLYCFADSGTGQ